MRNSTFGAIRLPLETAARLLATGRRPRGALKLKGRSAPKAVPRRGSAPAGQETEVARLTRELLAARRVPIL